MSPRVVLPWTRAWRVGLAALVGLLLVAGAAPAVASAAPSGTVITGRATDAAGNPLAGVKVYFDANFDPANNPVDPQLATTTASDGTYRAVRATTAGQTWLLFVGSVATGRSSDAGYLDGYRLNADGSRTVITPKAGGRVAGADVKLGLAGGARGRVTGSDGHPLAHVYVSLITTTALPDDLDQVTQTDANGEWSMTGVDLAGRTSVTATFQFTSYAATGGTSATGYPNACLGVVPTPCYRGSAYVGPTPRSVKLVPGKAVTGADVVLPAAAEAHGRLTDAAGRAIANSGLVYLFGSAVTLPDGGPVDLGGATTAADGTWTAPRLFPGTYAVCYGYYGGIVSSGEPDDNGYVGECSHHSPLAAGARAGTLYRLAAGQRVRVDDSLLVANGGLVGKVVDQAGTPLSDAVVRVGTVDANGQLSFASGISALVAPDGTWAIGQQAPGRKVVCASLAQYKEVCPVTSGGTRVTVQSSRTTTVPTLVLHRVS